MKIEEAPTTIFDEQISRKPNRYPWTEEFINFYNC